MGLDALAVGVATGGYLSYIPSRVITRGKWTGAGLIGTIEGALLYPLLPEKPVLFGLLLAAAVLASCWLCGRAEKALGRHDDSRIVLDEIVGYWSAVAFLPRTPAIMVTGFALFRLLDSVKLPPYRWLERLPGGYGIVADDVGAAVFVNLALRALIGFWPRLAL